MLLIWGIRAWKKGQVEAKEFEQVRVRPPAPDPATLAATGRGSLVSGLIDICRPRDLLIDNMALALFLGMCSFRRGVQAGEHGARARLAVTVIVLETITVPLNNLDLRPTCCPEGALTWISEDLAAIWT